MKRINIQRKLSKQRSTRYTFITRDRIDFQRVRTFSATGAHFVCRNFDFDAVRSHALPRPLTQKVRSKLASIRFDSELTFELVNTGIIERYNTCNRRDAPAIKPPVVSRRAVNKRERRRIGWFSPRAKPKLARTYRFRSGHSDSNFVGLFSQAKRNKDSGCSEQSESTLPPAPFFFPRLAVHSRSINWEEVRVRDKPDVYVHTRYSRALADECNALIGLIARGAGETGEAAERTKSERKGVTRWPLTIPGIGVTVKYVLVWLKVFSLLFLSVVANFEAEKQKLC